MNFESLHCNEIWKILQDTFEVFERRFEPALKTPKAPIATFLTDEIDFPDQEFDVVAITRRCERLFHDSYDLAPGVECKSESVALSKG